MKKAVLLLAMVMLAAVSEGEWGTNHLEGSLWTGACLFWKGQASAMAFGATLY